MPHFLLRGSTSGNPPQAAATLLSHDPCLEIISGLSEQTAVPEVIEVAIFSPYVVC